jgi:hypothetical protein
MESKSWTRIPSGDEPLGDEVERQRNGLRYVTRRDLAEAALTARGDYDEEVDDDGDDDRRKDD